MREHARTVEVFGGRVALRGAGREAPLALAVAEALLRRMHAALTRFDPRSELCLLNADPRATVPASGLVRRLAAAVPYAGALSGGLVDATVEPALIPERSAFRKASRAPRRPIRSGAGRRCRSMPRRSRARPASPWTAAGWARAWPPTSSPTGCARCPPTRSSASATSASAAPRAPCASPSPWDDEVLAELTLTDGAAATSGVTRRGWHLIDPGTGRPARTGIVQATALAPTGLEAEVRAKAALLAGPAAARDHLPHGGLLVLADGEIVSL